jgi:hypothetical protein
LTLWIRWLKRAALVLMTGGLFFLVGAAFYFVRVRVVDDRRIPFALEPREGSGPPPVSSAEHRTGRIAWTAVGTPLLKTTPSIPEAAVFRKDHPESDFKWDPAVPGTARVTLGDFSGRTRLVALAGTVGSVFEWRGVMPAGAWFQCRIGLLATEGGVLFSLDLEESPAGETKRVYSETLSASPLGVSEKEPWRPIRVDLSDWGGKTVRIRLNTAVAEPVGSEVSCAALWGTPEIRFPQPALVASRPRKNPLDLPILLAAFESTPDDLLFPLQTSRSRLSGFLGESVWFPFFYTADVRPDQSLESLIFLSSAAWPDILGRHGYRTRAVGAFSDEMMDLLDRAGFEEIHRCPLDGYDTIRSAGRAVSWVRDSSSAGDFVFLYFSDMPRGRWGPVRYWARGTPIGVSRWSQWKRSGEDAYRDDYFGRVVDSVDEKEGEWIVGAVSLRGRGRVPVPVVKTKTGRSKMMAMDDSGGGMREREIRVVFGLRSLQRWAPGLCRSPGQIPDVGSTLMGTLHMPVVPGRGRVWALDKAASLSDSSGAWVVRSGRSKAVVVDGRYKYIRHGSLRASTTARGGSAWGGVQMDYPAEEVFDLWNDPGERKDLARERRNLLARLRDVLDEMDPDPAEVRLSFLNPTGRRVDGMINCIQGQLGGVVTSVGGRRMGDYEFIFSTNAVSGDIRFRTWPPLVPFRLRVLVDGKSLDPSRIQVGRWGIPLFEIKGDEWFDKTKFGWMDGWAPPRPSTDTVVSVGRVAPAPSEGVP